jgi:CTD kinase subunit gamma
MYFLEHLCDMAAREGHLDYVRMMQRDILRVVDAVAPEDGSGAANVKVVRKVRFLFQPHLYEIKLCQVLQGLQQKEFLLPQTVLEIEECLRERDTLPDHVGLSPPITTAEAEASGSASLNASEPGKAKQSGATQRLDKKQIEQRIEEDRERHKRLREHQWAISNDDDDAEFYQMLEETSSVGSDDYRLFEEEAMQREQCAKEHAEEMDAIFAAQSQREE